MSQPMIIRVFERQDGSQVLVYYWPEEPAMSPEGFPNMQVAEQPPGGQWGVPLRQISNQDQP